MGPLEGVKVVEMAGLGPGPFCGMMLADMGAQVIRLDRKSGGGAPVAIDHSKDVVGRGRSSVSIDLKHPEGCELALQLIAVADMVFEGFRPGVAERLGLGPDACLARNPRLIYGRVTGWGQHGPLAGTAGHDINFIALSGALEMLGRKGEPPTPPINLVGDYAGGGLLLAFGMVCALFEARRSGKGQVIDAAMFEGASLLMAATRALSAMGHWSDQRGSNFCDTGSHFYEVYETSDNRHVAVGAIEPQFYRELMNKLGIVPENPQMQMDPLCWRERKSLLAGAFLKKTRDEWAAIFSDGDGCVTPVLSLAESPLHPHSIARQSFITINGLVQPAPAPKFSRTVPETRGVSPIPGEGGDALMESWGLSSGTIGRCRAVGAMV